MPECTWKLLEHDAMPILHRGYRRAIVSISPQCFGGAVHSTRYAVFDYRGANFCIEPPHRQSKLVVAWDVLSKFSGEKGWRELSANEMEFAKHWPEGRAARDCETYDERMRYCSLKASISLSYRLCYTTPVYDFMVWNDGIHRCLHPYEHRLLSSNEIEALFARYKIGDWCEAQAQACIADEWEEQDWESSFDGETEEWIGTEEPGKDVKHFDLCAWRGYYFDVEEYKSKIKQRLKHVQGKRNVQA